jgi:hypothetical protein
MSPQMTHRTVSRLFGLRSGICNNKKYEAFTCCPALGTGCERKQNEIPCPDKKKKKIHHLDGVQIAKQMGGREQEGGKNTFFTP